MRTKAGLKTKEVAGISESYVRQIEGGRKIPSEKYIWKLSKALADNPNDHKIVGELKCEFERLAAEQRNLQEGVLLRRQVQEQNSDADSRVVALDDILHRLRCADYSRATDLRDFLHHLAEPFSGLGDARPKTILTAFVEAPSVHSIGHIKVQAIFFGHQGKRNIRFRPRSVGRVRQSVFHLRKGEIIFISDIADGGSSIPIELEQGENTLVVIAAYPKHIVDGESRPTGCESSICEYRAWNAVEVGDYARHGGVEYRFAVASPNQIHIMERLHIRGRPGNILLEGAKPPRRMSQGVLKDTIGRISTLVRMAVTARDLPTDLGEGYTLTQADFRTPPYRDAFNLLIEPGAFKAKDMRWESDYSTSQCEDVFYVTSTRRPRRTPQ